MSVRIFLSTVSDEFGAYRDQLRGDLTRHNVEVKVQEDLKDYGGVTLDKLDLYIGSCDAVVHLVGDMIGSEAKSASMASILAISAMRFGPSAGARAGRRGFKRRSPPIATPSPNGPASACHTNGLRPRTISALRLRH
jgi:hypothetical protein